MMFIDVVRCLYVGTDKGMAIWRGNTNVMPDVTYRHGLSTVNFLFHQIYNSLYTKC